jgi:hypothetical protein
MKKARVITDHQPDSTGDFIVRKGDIVKGIEKPTNWEGWLWCWTDDKEYAWIPKPYLKPVLDKSGTFILLRDYNAKELTIGKDEEVVIQFEASSWAWVKTRAGEEGWIPLGNLKIQKQ